MSNRLSGKVALVTGGTSGIGQAAVQQFLKEGCRVLFTGRRTDLGKQIEASQSSLGYEVLFHHADHRNSQDCEATVEATIQRFGRVDVLFNNAGIVLLEKTAEETSEDEWQEVMDLNVTAVWRMSKLVLPLMRKQGGGVIINNASDWGIVGGRRALAYCTSKGAVVNMTRAMALDHARDKIRVLAVCPGDTFVARWIARDRRRVLKEGEKEEDLDDQEVRRRLSTSDEIPLGRVGEAGEVAEVVVFMASSAASFMTGAIIPVDGGNTAQ